MAELELNDLPNSVRDRFENDADAQAALDAALVAARRYCRWHVSPLLEAAEVLLDGPCGALLDLPTRKLVDLTEVTEDGTARDVTTLDWSENGSVRKQSGACWSCRYRSIAVTMDHGYTEAEAADWRQAILTMIDDMSSPNAENAGPLVRKKVDDVEYQWDAAAEQALLSVGYVLDSYRLFPVLFV